MTKKLGFLLLIFLTILFAYNLIGQIFNTLKSGERLDQVVQKLHQLEVKNRELKKRLEEVKSPEFLEQQARDKLGLAKEGETVVIIPQEKIDQILGASRDKEEGKLPNWLGWLRLFF